MLNNYPYKTAFIRNFIAQGREEGREEGELLATRAVLQDLFSLRFPAEAEALTALLARVPLPDLQVRTRRLLAAPDLATTRAILLE